jgi:histidinol-phosphate aminotransferase
MLNLTDSHILSMPLYIAGKDIEQQSNILFWSKLASNENPLGPSKKSLDAIKYNLTNINLYPNANKEQTILSICHHYKEFDLKPTNIALGNGSSELIVNLVRGIVGYKESVLNAWPTFVMYKLAIMAHGKQEISVKLDQNMNYDLNLMLKIIKDNNQQPIKLLFLGNPNNPTGTYISKNLFIDFVKNLPTDLIVVIDEAYFEYICQKDYLNGLEIALSRPRTIVLRTFSKIYALAGLRIGYAIGDKDIISILSKIADPFNVNALAQVAAMAALSDKEHVQNSIDNNNKMKPILINKLKNLGFLVGNTEGNFVLAKRSSHMSSINNLCKKLFEKGVIIRSLDSYQMDDYVRISVGNENQIDHFINELKLLI